MKPLNVRTRRLETLLQLLAPLRVAVSGGVDSLTLALIAARLPTPAPTLFHAVSPAVPPQATARVQAVAAREGWDLRIIDAGEFDDPDYRRNPYDRCFHCKDNLYAAIAAQGAGVIASGANLDDLDDYRPGLKAAEQHRVRHPFVEAELRKDDIRRLARELGYPDLAALPASPCLASRIHTGIRIRPEQLRFVHQVELQLQQALQPAAVRCRIRPDEIAIELDPQALQRLNGDQTAWLARIQTLAADQGLPARVRFEPYRMGSAFVAS